MFYPIRKPNQGWQVVTISYICYKVIFTISDTYCTSTYLHTTQVLDSLIAVL